jgi:hypothetical protein
VVAATAINGWPSAMDSRVLRRLKLADKGKDADLWTEWLRPGFPAGHNLWQVRRKNRGVLPADYQSACKMSWVRPAVCWWRQIEISKATEIKQNVA